MINHVVEILSLHQLEYEMEHVDLPDDYIFFEIGYCGHPAFPYSRVQQEKATKIIISYLQDEYHLLIYDAPGNNKAQLVCLYFAYRPKKTHLEQI